MATSSEIEIILELMHSCKSKKLLKDIEMTEDGSLAVIKYLYENNNVKSKDISDFMGISSARMVVILKKLEKKELITKETSLYDSRVINVNLTKKGVDYTSKIKANLEKKYQKL